MDTSEEYVKMSDCPEIQGVIPITAIAYLAGLIDGEGCVQLRRVDNRKNMSHKVLLTITSTNIHVLNWVEKIFGGTVYIHDRKDGIRKPQGRWYSTTQLAYRTLKMTAPYLIIKKKLAEKAIEFTEKLNGDASWHEKFAKEFRGLQQKEIKDEYPIHALGQDQIQEMMEGVDNFKLIYGIAEYIERNDANYLMGKENRSMEQLWLAFYMYEKHGKIWNGEKWVKPSGKI